MPLGSASIPMAKAVCPRCGARLRPSAAGGPPVCPTCPPHHGTSAETKTSAGDVPSPAVTDYRGRTIGNYTILEEISRGAMGVVYKARQQVLNRVVALKVLIAGDLATEAQVARFQREAQAAARLRHPAIVPIHEVGIFEGKHFYTMDYIQGRPLSAFVAEGKITTRRALDITASLADALDYAHGEGVVHRDIKPGNVMIDPRGRVHIMDFGLAKQLDSDTKFTRTGTTVGTPAYMPPEQASGESRRVDHRADIYSLGAVLYEMLTGRPPFSGDTMMSTLMQVLNDDPVPPKRLNPRIHRDIQTIVLKAMEKPPDRRYLAMAALAADIRHFIAGESITARPAGLFYRAWKGLKKHRSAVFAAAAVLVIGLTAFAVVEQERQGMDRRIKEERKDVERKVTRKMEQELQEQEKPAVRTVFEDKFDGPLGRDWLIEEGPWKASPGCLEVRTGALAAIRTKKQFTGHVTVTFEMSLPARADGSRQTRAVVGYFIGPEWRQSYRVSFDGRRRPRLVLMDRRSEVAEVECPPLQPDVPYLTTVQRSSLRLAVSIKSESGDMQQELAYNDLLLPRRLGRSFPVGVFAEGAHLRIHRFRVEQEFSPLKTSPIRAADELFRDGNFAEARNLCQKIAQGYEGTYEGLAARFRIARSYQAENLDARARDILRRIEDQASGIQHDELPELLTQIRLLRFLCCARLNKFAEATKALARVATDRGQVDPAWVWHIPKHIGDMLNNRAYDEALGLLRADIFGPDRQTLYALASSLQAPTLQTTLASRVRLLAEGLCDHAQASRVKDVYAAYPTPILADAFARAATQALRGDQHDEALALLAFCTEHKLASPALTQAAVGLATRFRDSDRYARLVDLYTAFPDPKLAPVFIRAVNKATDAGKLDEALVLLELSAEKFAGEADALVAADGPAIRLAKAFLARGDVLKPVKIHSIFGPAAADPAFVTLFVEATQKALDTKKPDEALRLLEHCRENFGVLHTGLAAAAAQLITFHAEHGNYDKAAAAYLAYRNEAVAPAAANAIASAADAGRLHDALTLFRQYARSRHPLPQQAIHKLAQALVALDPLDEDTTTLLDQYAAVYELYESPAARSTMTLALGDAFLSKGRLSVALGQYEAAGDAEGHLRAGCLALELGRTERAAALWHSIGELAKGNDGWSATATFMLGATTVPDFRRAAAQKKLGPALTHYLVGLRLWAQSDAAASQELALAAAAQGAWFTRLAKRSRAPFTAAEEDTPE